MSASEAPALDPAMVRQLREMSGGDPAILVELLGLFEADAVPLLAAIDAAITAGDPGALRESAHALKGGAANLGASPLADACAKLEALGRAGRVAGATGLALEARGQYARACAALRAELGST